MRISFFRESTAYLLKACSILMVFFLPLIASTWLIDLYNLGPVAKINTFALSLMLSMLFLGILSRLKPLCLANIPRFELKRAHWETAMDIIAWIRRHDMVCFFAAVMGLATYSVPLNAVWLWLLSLHIFVSTSSAIALFFGFILISFLVPTMIVQIAYTSIVKPKKASVKQMNRIIGTIYSDRQLTGEMLEKSKKTMIRVPTKRMKIMLIPIIVMMVTADIVLQLIEMRFIPEKIVIYVPALILPCFLMLLPMFFMGKKKTELDVIWNEQWKQKSQKTDDRRVKSVRQIIRRIKKSAVRIKNSLWYNVLVTLAKFLSLVISILELLKLRKVA